MEHRNLQEECLVYFISTPILKKILKSCIDKYRSFGTACGTVILRGLSLEDIEILEGFTGKNYHGKKNLSMNTTVIQKAIDKSRFDGILLDELLDLYCGGNLKSKKQEAFEVNTAIVSFYEKLQAEYADTRAGMWLQEVRKENNNRYKMLQKKYKDKVLVEEVAIKEAEKKLQKEMKLWMNAMNHLPVFRNTYEYLPSFAATVTGDPHYFDEGKEYTLFLYYAIWDMLQINQQVSASMSAEEKHQLLFEAGLIKDTMSNDVMVYGIRAWRKEGEHQGIAGFCEQKEPLSITLSTILGLKSVKCIGNCIYVVENPIVFAQIVEMENQSVLCVNGQPNLAVLLLLDLITKSKGTIYYNGDFDPEGLMIAQRLKNRYGKFLHFWHYEKEDYDTSMSDKPISEKRLKMLEGLSSPELIQIGKLITKHRKAGYQERIFGDVTYTKRE
jgi:uncharacterized protein (TIGR02679 family)